MKWIRAHKFVAGIISAALVLCLIIVFSYLNGGSAGIAGGQIEKAVALIQRPIAALSYGIKDNILGFRNIIAENEELKKENAALKTEVNNLTLTERDLQELRDLSRVLNYDVAAYDRQIVSANVISLDGTNWFNIITTDKGSDDGIYKDAIVVNGDGLVGTVMDVGSNWAKVISTIDETNKVSFIVLRDPDLVGIMQGDGNGGLNGFMLDNQAGVIEGDLLVTSGIGMYPMYPKGIEIGKVTSVSYNTDTQLKTVTIEPSVKFINLRKVTVII